MDGLSRGAGGHRLAAGEGAGLVGGHHLHLPIERCHGLDSTKGL
jgi:hypothetical protein